MKDDKKGKKTPKKGQSPLKLGKKSPMKAFATARHNTNIALKNLVLKMHPLVTCSKFAKFSFSWLKNPIRLSKAYPWKQKMHYFLPPEDKAATNKEAFRDNLNDSRSLIKTTGVLFKGSIRTVVLSAIFAKILLFLGIFFLIESAIKIDSGALIGQIEASAFNLGALLGSSLLIALSGFITQYSNFEAKRLSLRLRSATSALLSELLLEFRVYASRQFKAGQLINLLQIDTERLKSLIPGILALISAITSTILCIIYLGIKLTPLGLGFAVFPFVVVPGHLIVLFYRWKAQRRYLHAQDHRISLIKSALESLEYLKLSNLENFFCLEIYEIRENEIYWLRTLSYAMGCQSGVLWTIRQLLILSAVPAVVSVVKFCQKRKIEVGDKIQFLDVLMIIGCVELLAVTQENLFGSLNSLVDVSTSITRLQKFIFSEPFNTDHVDCVEDHGTPLALKIVNGTFRHRFGPKEETQQIDSKIFCFKQKKTKGCLEDEYRSLISGFQSKNGEPKPSEMPEEVDPTGTIPGESHHHVLKGINLDLQKGKKVMVVGRNGAGATSFLEAILGELMGDGPVGVLRNGKYGYVEQERWLFEGTIKTNIALSGEVKGHLLQFAISESLLDLELEGFVKGLDTEIGKNCENLGASQKVKICLARCIYQK